MLKCAAPSAFSSGSSFTWIFGFDSDFSTTALLGGQVVDGVGESFNGLLTITSVDVDRVEACESRLRVGSKSAA